MFKKPKFNKKIGLAIATGIIALFLYGSYNTIQAMENQNGAGINGCEITTQSSEYMQKISFTGCPGNCTACGLCSGASQSWNNRLTMENDTDVTSY